MRRLSRALWVVLIIGSAVAGRAVDAAIAPDGLTLVGRIGGHVGSVVASGNDVYASYGLRLHVLDMTDPAAVVERGDGPYENGQPVLLPGNLAQMVLAGDRIVGLVDWDRAPPLASDSRQLLVVLSIAPGQDRLRPRLLGQVELPGYTRARDQTPVVTKLAVAGDHAFAIGRDERGTHLSIVDLSDPAAPAVVGRFEPAELHGEPVGLAAPGSWLYVLARRSGGEPSRLVVFDAANPTLPRQAGDSSTVPEAMDVVVAAGHAFVVGCGALEVFALADPAAPRSIASLPLESPPGPTPGPTPAPPSGQPQCEAGAEIAWHAGWLYALTTVPASASSAPSEVNTLLWSFDVRQPAAPALAARIELPGKAQQLAVGDGYAVTAGPADGLRAVDLSAPDRPRDAGPAVAGRKIIAGVAGSGTTVVQSAGYGMAGWLEFIDAGDPARATVVGRSGLTDPWTARDLVLAGRTAYAVIEGRGLVIVDAADLAAPRFAAVVPPLADAQAVAVVAGHAFVAESDTRGGAARGALRILDVSQPTRPVELGRVSGSYEVVAASGNYAYAVSGSVLHVIDVAVPASPQPIGELELGGVVLDLEVDGGYAYVLGVSVLKVLSLADLAAPRLVAELALQPAEPPPADAPLDLPVRLARRGSVLYVGSTTALRTVDIGDPTAPQLVASRQVPSHLLLPSPLIDWIPGGGYVATAGHAVYVAGDMTGLWVFDVGQSTYLPEIYLPAVARNFGFGGTGTGVTSTASP